MSARGIWVRGTPLVKRAVIGYYMYGESSTKYCEQLNTFLDSCICFPSKCVNVTFPVHLRIFANSLGNVMKSFFKAKFSRPTLQYTFWIQCGLLWSCLYVYEMFATDHSINFHMDRHVHIEPDNRITHQRCCHAW